MPARCLDVGLRTSKPPDEKSAETLFRAGKVRIGVHGSEDIVVVCTRRRRQCR